MAQTITSCMQLAFQTTATYALTVTDDLGVGRTVNIAPGWFRMFLAPATGLVGASSTAPTSFVSYLETRLNAGTAGWHVAINTSGFPGISWTGARNPATITWDVTNVVRNLLGYTGGVSVAPNASQAAAYHPTHTLYMVGRANDTGWIRVPPMSVSGELPTGQVFGWQDKRKRFRRTFDSKVHPKDWAARTALGASATPFTGDVSRISQASATPGVVPPWGCDDFFDAALGNSIGALFGNFQTYLTGGVATCERVYTASRTLTAETPQKLEQPNNSNWFAWPGISLIRDGVTPSDTF